MRFELFRNVNGINISLGLVPDAYIPKQGEIKTLVRSEYVEDDRIMPIDLTGVTTEQITELKKIIESEDYKKLLVYYNQLGHNYCCVVSILKILPNLKKALDGI